MRSADPRKTGARRAPGLAAACVLAIALAACQHAPPPPRAATPAQTVTANLRLASDGDFDGLMRNRLPPADYARWRTEWTRAHAHPRPVSKVQRQQFAKVMHTLTEPGAKTRLAARLKPELARMRGGKNAPTPIFIRIIEAAGNRMIASSPQLGPAQRTLAADGLAALVAWAKTADFGDPKRAEKAIDLVVTTARKLDVHSLTQWRALDYGRTMRDYGILWRGLEKLLHLYGLDLAGSLTDARMDTVAEHGPRATVKLSMRFAGRTLTGEWPMQKEAGDWYDTALLRAWRKAHPAAAGSTAVAGSAAGAATSGRPANTATTAVPARTGPPQS